MNPLDKLNEIQVLLGDYNEELWADEQVRDNLMFLLGRFISTGQDISDDELSILKDFLKLKVDQYVKNKGN